MKHLYLLLNIVKSSCDHFNPFQYFFIRVFIISVCITVAFIIFRSFSTWTSVLIIFKDAHIFEEINWNPHECVCHLMTRLCDVAIETRSSRTSVSIYALAILWLGDVAIDTRSSRTSVSVYALAILWLGDVAISEATGWCCYRSANLSVVGCTNGF